MVEMTFNCLSLKDKKVFSGQNEENLFFKLAFNKCKTYDNACIGVTPITIQQ